MAGNQSSGGRGAGKSGGKVGRARSLGAAAMGGNPSGAILDDTEEVLLQRKQRFKAWAKGYRDKSITSAKEPSFNYSKSPKPGA